MNYEQLIFKLQQWQKDTVQKIIVDFKAQSVTFSIPAKNRKSCKLFSTAKMQELRDRLQACQLENWNCEYTQPVIGGTVWQLELLNGQKVVKASCGENRFPKNWDAFYGIIQEYSKASKKFF